jgi:hypothetical protein
MSLRRDVLLPPGDVEFLDSAFPKWEAIRNGAATWLLLPEFTVPDGYNHNSVTASLRLEAGYPDTQIDMVYFSPSLTRKDGKAIGATGNCQLIDGRQFQRWSRHRTPGNPWRSGVDDIEAHIILVKHWLEREFAK